MKCKWCQSTVTTCINAAYAPFPTWAGLSNSNCEHLKTYFRPEYTRSSHVMWGVCSHYICVINCISVHTEGMIFFKGLEKVSLWFKMCVIQVFSSSCFITKHTSSLKSISSCSCCTVQPSAVPHKTVELSSFQPHYCHFTCILLTQMSFYC